MGALLSLYTDPISYPVDCSVYLVDKSILDAIRKERKSKSAAGAMNDYELVIRVSKELEELFKREFRVQDCRSLHDCINAVEDRRRGLKAIFHQTDGTFIQNIRYLATIRNKLVHEQNFHHIPDRELYLDKFKHSCEQLTKIIPQLRRQQEKEELLDIYSDIIGLLLFYLCVRDCQTQILLKYHNKISSAGATTSF